MRYGGDDDDDDDAPPPPPKKMPRIDDEDGSAQKKAVLPRIPKRTDRNSRDPLHSRESFVAETKVGPKRKRVDGGARRRASTKSSIICMFFGKGRGCRNGNNCKFLHEERSALRWQPPDLPGQLGDRKYVQERRTSTATENRCMDRSRSVHRDVSGKGVDQRAPAMAKELQRSDRPSLTQRKVSGGQGGRNESPPHTPRKEKLAMPMKSGFLRNLITKVDDGMGTGAATKDGALPRPSPPIRSPSVGRAQKAMGSLPAPPFVDEGKVCSSSMAAKARVPSETATIAARKATHGTSWKSAVKHSGERVHPLDKGHLHEEQKRRRSSSFADNDSGGRGKQQKRTSVSTPDRGLGGNVQQGSSSAPGSESGGGQCSPRIDRPSLTPDSFKRGIEQDSEGEPPPTSLSGATSLAVDEPALHQVVDNKRVTDDGRICTEPSKRKNLPRDLLPFATSGRTKHDAVAAKPPAADSSSRDESINRGGKRASPKIYSDESPAGHLPASARERQESSQSECPSSPAATTVDQRDERSSKKKRERDGINEAYNSATCLASSPLEKQDTTLSPPAIPKPRNAMITRPGINAAQSESGSEVNNGITGRSRAGDESFGSASEGMPQRDRNCAATTSGETPHQRDKCARDQQWQERFEELKRFSGEHGHCRVPTKRSGQLGHWVSGQRREYKKWKEDKRTSMTNERVEKLEGIGFCWTLRKTRRTSKKATEDRCIAEKGVEDSARNDDTMLDVVSASSGAETDEESDEEKFPSGGTESLQVKTSGSEHGSGPDQTSFEAALRMIDEVERSSDSPFLPAKLQGETSELAAPLDDVDADGIVLVCGEKNGTCSVHLPWPARVVCAMESYCYRQKFGGERHKGKVCVFYFFPCWEGMSPASPAKDRWYQIDFVDPSKIISLDDSILNESEVPLNVLDRYGKAWTVALGLKYWACGAKSPALPKLKKCEHRGSHDVHRSIRDYGAVLNIPDDDWLEKSKTYNPGEVVNMITTCSPCIVYDERLSKESRGDLGDRFPAFAASIARRLDGSGSLPSVAARNSSATFDEGRPSPVRHGERAQQKNAVGARNHNFYDSNGGKVTSDAVNANGATNPAASRGRNVKQEEGGADLETVSPRANDNGQNSLCGLLANMSKGVGQNYARKALGKGRSVSSGTMQLFRELSEINATGVKANLPCIMWTICRRIIDLEEAKMPSSINLSNSSSDRVTDTLRGLGLYFAGETKHPEQKPIFQSIGATCPINIDGSICDQANFLCNQWKLCRTVVGEKNKADPFDDLLCMLSGLGLVFSKKTRTDKSARVFFDLSDINRAPSTEVAVCMLLNNLCERCLELEEEKEKFNA